MMKNFELKVNQKTVLEIDIYGDDDLVQPFTKLLVDTFGVFDKLKEPMTNLMKSKIDEAAMITVPKMVKKVSREK